MSNKELNKEIEDLLVLLNRAIKTVQETLDLTEGEVTSKILPKKNKKCAKIKKCEKP